MDTAQLEEFLDLKTLIERYPQFTENQIRWLIVNKARLAFAHVYKKVGRRIYIHVPSLVKWIQEQKN